jgi:glycosyltransferase 2 family protein
MIVQACMQAAIVRTLVSTQDEAAVYAPSRTVQLAGFVVSAVALAAVLWWIVHQDAPSLPNARAELVAFAAAIAAYSAATAARAERWVRLLGGSGSRPARMDAYGLIAVGYMGNNVLPARGGDLLRVYLMASRGRTSKRTVIGTLIAERLLDVVFLFIVFVLLAYGVIREVDAPNALLLAGIVVAVIAGLAAGFLAIGLVRRRGLFERSRAWVRPISSAARSWRRPHGAAVVLLTALVWTFESATYLAVAYAVDWTIEPLEALYLVALTGLFVVVPAGPSNAGTLDAGVLLGVKALGGSGAQAIAYLLVLRFVLLMPITVTGLTLLLVRYGGLASLRNRARPEP